MPSEPAEVPRRPDWIVIGGFTVVALLLHLIFYKGYGFFRDELYFIACSHHLDWGYVDQPPGVAVVAWAARALLGDTLFAIRFVPAIFAALQIMFTGLTAASMGGRRYGQALACIGVLAAPQYFGSYLNTDMFMTLGWAACAWVVARILAGDNPRLWLLFGLFAGLALQGKHAMLFFGFALTVGLVLSPQRKILLGPWPWAGAALAFLIALPNLIWEYQHHWATYELLSNIAKSNKNLVLGPVQYLLSNTMSLSIFSAPVWMIGLAWLLAARGGHRFRALGWAWIAAFVTFLALKGKDYYLTPAYSTLFAAGAVAIDSCLPQQKIGGRILRPVIAVVVLLGGMIGWPYAMPMMSAEKFIAYQEALGTKPHKTETMELAQLSQQYSDMFGWPEMAQETGRVFNTLAPEERAHCGVLAQNYGEAGAIDYFGRQYGLPHAISGHQNYWLWGPGEYTGQCLVVIGNNRERLEQLFNDVRQAGETNHPLAIPYENHRPIWIVRGPKFGTLQDLWPKLKGWR